MVGFGGAATAGETGKGVTEVAKDGWTTDCKAAGIGWVIAVMTFESSAKASGVETLLVEVELVDTRTEFVDGWNMLL